ncbi:RNA polymerase sigma factor [Sphingomonas turrisvirgatae]|nr:sigma-70 family RNA polymerase sigma factor [Sphingomonas turrisvirgatae]
MRNPACDENVAFLALRYKRAVHAYFLRRVADRAEADDLTQEVYAALARRGQGDEVENLEGYVFRVATNLLRDRARRKRTQPELESTGSADPFARLIDPISPERQAIGRDDYQRFIEALETLPERPRMVFVLNRFEEMSGREIAALLGLSQRQIEKDISRVLTLLRTRLS